MLQLGLIVRPQKSPWKSVVMGMPPTPEEFLVGYVCQTHFLALVNNELHWGVTGQCHYHRVRVICVGRDLKNHPIPPPLPRTGTYTDVPVNF